MFYYNHQQRRFYNTRKKIVLLCLNDIIKTHFQKKYHTGEQTILIGENAQVGFYFHFNQDNTSYLTIQLQIYGYVIYVENVSINLEKLLKNMLKSNSLDKCYRNINFKEKELISNYDLPDWFIQEVEIEWRKLEYSYTTNFIHQEQQMQIDTPNLDINKKDDINTKRVLSLLRSVLSESLEEDSVPETYSIHTKIQAYKILHEIIDSLEIEINDETIKEIFTKALKNHQE